MSKINYYLHASKYNDLPRIIAPGGDEISSRVNMIIDRFSDDKHFNSFPFSPNNRILDRNISKKRPDFKLLDKALLKFNHPHNILSTQLVLDEEDKKSIFKLQGEIYVESEF